MSFSYRHVGGLKRHYDSALYGGLISFCVFSSFQALQAQAVQAQDYICDRAHLSKSVTGAGQEIERLNAENTVKFQAKLRDLKQKKGWSDQQMMQKGEAYIKDEQIISLDRENQVHLASISDLGTLNEASSPEEVAQSEADCIMVVELNAHLRDVIKVTRRKWDFLFSQIERDLKSGE